MEKVPRKEQLRALYRKDTNEYVQPTTNDLPLEIRLVHQFVCTIPKTGKFEHVTDREFFFL